MCQSTLLSAKGNSTISFCPKCQNHYICQSAYLLSFSQFQYDCFCQEVKKKIGNEEFLVFPNGESKMILTTPVQEILFTFTKEEWWNFTSALDEAYYMREVYRIIH